MDEPISKGFTGLGDGQFPVFTENGNFSVKVPMSKKKLPIRRKQFPLEPAYSCTGHKSQGQTLPKVVADLGVPAGMKKVNTSFAYMPLSRVRCLKDLYLLRPCSLDVLKKKAPIQLQDMMKDFMERDICKDV